MQVLYGLVHGLAVPTVSAIVALFSVGVETPGRSKSALADLDRVAIPTKSSVLLIS